MATLRPTTFWQRVVLNFVTRKQAKGAKPVLIGTDYMGNVYFEKNEAGLFERRIGESDTVMRGKRWYFPVDEDSWDNPIPPEWEAWLRYRRLEHPTEEEIMLNLAVSHVKKLNSKKLMELEAGTVKLEGPQDPGLVKKDEGQETDEEMKIPAPQYSKWPVYEDLEMNPGAPKRVIKPFPKK